MGGSPRRYGTPEDLAEHISANFFPVSPATFAAVASNARPRIHHDLGPSPRGFRGCQIATRLLKIAGPASMKGPLAKRRRTAKTAEPAPVAKAQAEPTAVKPAPKRSAGSGRAA